VTRVRKIAAARARLRCKKISLLLGVAALLLLPGLDSTPALAAEALGRPNAREAFLRPKLDLSGPIRLAQVQAPATPEAGADTPDDDDDNDAEPDEPENARERPHVPGARIQATEAPVIDGDLSDPAWEKATVIEDFRQRTPVPGSMPTERTVIRIMYDTENIYFGVYAYDSSPELITVRAMSRDGELNTGDNIQVALDPGLTRRNSYLFMMGPSGGRYDALRLNNTEELREWNTIWSGRARRVADGWVAEMAIPYRSISYTPGQEDWGIDFTRVIRRKPETVRWSSYNPAIQLQDISEAGTLEGIKDISQGIGLDVVPYTAFRAKHDWSNPNDGAGLSQGFGGNVFYKVTPSLTGTLTFNPDFSDAPLDDRIVNTTRFSVFFPETRSFFLQDAGNFEFGGRAFRRTNFDRQSTNGRPFFSRNLGLVRGAPVSLIHGAKLSGEFAGFNVGALTVHTDNTLTRDGQQLSVVRMTRQFGNFRTGFIATHGDPTGLTTNSLAGTDLQYRSLTLVPGKTVQSDVFFQRSYSSAAGNGNSYGLDITFPNEPWNGEFTFKTIDANFTPALGFANRRDIRLYDLFIGRLIRNPIPFLRTFETNTRQELFTNLDGTIQTRTSRFQIQMETRRDTSYSFDFFNNFDRLNVDFRLPGNVLIPAGQYTWNNLLIHMRTSASFPLSFHFDGWCCDYYNGKEYRLRSEAFLKLNEFYELNFSHEGDYFRMPSGNIDIHTLSLDGVVNFTPDMQFTFQTQFDNISQGFGFLGRYRWEFRPGTELLIRFGQAALIPGNRFEARSTTASVRLTHTLRY
jgi:Domain of unknown function (DUF5916)